MESSKSDSMNCKYFVKRKKRFCRMTVKQGFEYCGEHEPSIKLDISSSKSSDSNNEGIRINCPYDNKHTCFAHNLEKHLKICNARPQPLEAFIIKGINTGSNNSVLIKAENQEIRQLSAVPVENIKDVIRKINKIHGDVIACNISTLHLKHNIVEEELQKPEYGDKTKKHLVQTSAILGLLNEYDLLEENVSFVEFGAGKGQLSYWIAKATANLQNSSVLLIERASLRHKLDNKLEKSNVHRIKADIADLVLNKVENIRKQIVGVTKHLCGDATDLAMRCVNNFQQSNSNDSVVNGLVMSFCCHHRCQWATYCGQEFFKENNLNQGDFDTMCGLVSWAVCGTGHSRTTVSKGVDELLPANERDVALGLKREEKEEIGRRSKMVLNYGRLRYLEKEMNLKCKLHYYVDRQISLENVCIVAVNGNKK